MIEFQRATRPLLAMLDRLVAGFEKYRTDEELQRYLRDVADHATTVAERVDSFRQNLSDILTVNATLVNQAQNEETKRLTEASFAQNEEIKRISAWAAILFAPTLIGTVYGMNFENIPELSVAVRLRLGARADGPDERRALADLPGPGLAVTGAAADPATRRARWQHLLDGDAPILADGAMGTQLFAAGLQFGDPPEVWNLSNPDIVRRIHRGYVDAGARIVLTNTFGGNRHRLALHNLENRVAELNRTAAILLRAEVDAAGGEALVAGDIGPSGLIMAPLGTLERDDAMSAFEEQARELIAGGVDVIWIETMSDLAEITAAVEGVRRASADIPVIATMTFDTRGHTMMGVSPEKAVAALAALGVDAIGGNCGNGPDEIVPVIEKMHAAAPDVILVAKSNAGMPQLIDMRAVYVTDAPTMAGWATKMREAGARVVGACCGSTAEHLAAMGAALGVTAED